MTTQSKHLRLAKPSTSDDFDTAEIAANWQAIDDAPGRHICTSLTRPSDWGANQSGRTIWETDTELEWFWDGADFYRSHAVGLLNTVERTSDFSTGSGTPQTVVSCGITWPDGDREVEVTATWPKAESDIGVVEISIYRDATQLQEWRATGTTSPGDPELEGEGGSMTIVDLPPSGAGVYTYTLKLNVPGGYSGTAYLRAAADAPISLTAKEI